MASNGNIKSDIRLCDMIVDILSNNPKGLAVSQIYAFLNKDKVFDSADNSWKGNVRHILSKKKYFLKSGYKESSKRGRFWVFDRKQYNKSRQRQGLPVDSQNTSSLTQENEFVEDTSFNALVSPACNASIYYFYNGEEKGSNIFPHITSYNNVNQSQFYVPANQTTCASIYDQEECASNVFLNNSINDIVNRGFVPVKEQCGPTSDFNWNQSPFHNPSCFYSSPLDGNNYKGNALYPSNFYRYS